MFIISDIKNVFEKDPAARGVFEVLFTYPGLHALWLYRISHVFYRCRLYTFARIISHAGRFLTGIEIHPGAIIGKRFFIDHGMGVVIGETAEIGNNCLLYQGVVLGGTSTRKEKRHPTLGNNVVVGAGAIILGAVQIGAGAKIGAGSVVLNDVPCGATAVGVPARVSLGFLGKEIMNLEHNKLPDPVRDAVNLVMKEMDLLESRLKKIEDSEGINRKIDEYLEKKKQEIISEFKSK
ncbi:MAG: serine O-acetyltransferase [bacterium]